MRLKGRLRGAVLVGIWFTSHGVSVASVEMGWVPIDDECQTPALDTVYVDPDSVRREGNLVALWQLTDYKLMQGMRDLDDFRLVRIGFCRQ